MSSYLAPSLSLSLSYLLYPYFLSHFRHSCLLRLECEVHAPCCGEPQCIQHTSHHTAPYAVPLPGTHESPVNAILTAGTCHSNTAVHRFSSYHLESGMDCMVSSYVTSANHSMSFTSPYNFSTALFQVTTVLQLYFTVLLPRRFLLFHTLKSTRCLTLIAFTLSFSHYLLFFFLSFSHASSESSQ